MRRTESFGYGLAAIAAAGTLMAGCGDGARVQAPALPEIAPSPSVFDPGVPQGPIEHVIVHPVTLRAPGFRPVDLSADTLRTTMTEAMTALHDATYGAVGSGDVTVAPVADMDIVSLRRPEDICDISRRRDATLELKRGLSLQQVNSTKHVIVLEPGYDPKCKDGDGAVATAGPGQPMMVYGASNYTRNTLFHEDGHWHKLPHAGALRCASRAMVDSSCGSLEYGDISTIMGSGGSYDQNDIDPLTGLQLFNLGALKESQVTTMSGAEPQTVELSAVANKDANVKLVRIPVTLSGNSLAINCAQFVNIELSSYSDLHDVTLHPLSVKAYLSDDRDVTGDSYRRPTYDLPIGHAGDDLTGITAADHLTVSLGSTTLEVTVENITSTGAGTGTAKVTLATTESANNTPPDGCGQFDPYSR